ncbi:putative DNA repair protein [Apostichopus japonicus]|uniref:Putative DNA repair protein n=1 Tax=Stichopus japonicus TaxID=307972 RepID=A0A2G8JXC6_STIJA|nr:putative DNA repair protein [Apostichopus japonicus]
MALKAAARSVTERTDRRLPQVHKTEPSPQTLVASESENFSSLAAIASCSYEARLAGVRNGMIMKTAKELCPELRTIPYNFEGYYRVSRQLYEIVAGYTHDIQAASCDEVILDVTNLMEETGATGAEIAEAMREEIYKKTKCTASAGLGKMGL